MQSCLDAKVVGLPGVDALALAVGSLGNAEKVKVTGCQLLNQYESIIQILILYVSMLICFHWSLYFLETSQFSGFFTLWLDGLFSFDCLILGDLQVLFLLFAGGGQRTRNRHIAQTPQA